MMAGGTLSYENDEIDQQDVTPHRPAAHPEPSGAVQELHVSKDFMTHFLSSTRNFPFDNLKVRQAISHAIDREAICRVLLQAWACRPGRCCRLDFPATRAASTGTFSASTRNGPDSACTRRDTRRGAGFPGSKCGSTTWGRQQVGQALQEMLKSHLGIDMTIRVVENISYRTAQYQRKIPFSLIQYHYDYPDPNNMLAMVWRSQPARIQPPSLDQRRIRPPVDEAASEMDAARRFRLYDPGPADSPPRTWAPCFSTTA